MIVLDASAVVEWITNEAGRSARVADELRADPAWACPGHMKLEAAHAMRGLWLGGRATSAAFEARVEALTSLNVRIVSTDALLPRVVELAANATAYDAAYLAAAEYLGAALVTVDRKLATIPGSRAEVRVVG